MQLMLHDPVSEGFVDDEEAREEPVVVECNLRHDYATFARAQGVSCPHCSTAPLDVMRLGGEITTTADAEYAVVACKACRKHVGTLKCAHGSMFGEYEDKRVLHGVWKVF